MTDPEPGAVVPKQADELRALIEAATDGDLTDGGRYFAETCNNLASCYHGDTGEFNNRADGRLVEWLWNNRHSILAGICAGRAEAGGEQRLREALEHIRDMCPATQEWSVAHCMADEAIEALEGRS